MESIKQKSQRLSYTLNSPVTVPFCPECHSYPCSCDDNIITYLLGATQEYRETEDNWPKLRYLECKKN